LRKLKVLRQTSEELSFVGKTLDLSATEWTDYVPTFDNLDEGRLIEVLQKNKVAVDFEKKLEMLNGPIDVFFNKFPAIKLFYQGIHAKIEIDSSAFEDVKNEFSKKNIVFILIKSADSFPYESDNLDILIKPNDLANVVQILRTSGYAELPQAREKNKFLFRKIKAFSELPLHIHTRVEWEGTPFIDSRSLWERKVFFGGGKGFFIPSHEDCILITAAHLFFEDHEIKLVDLFKIDSKIRDHNLNWDYIIDHAHGLHWDDAFSLTIFLLNRIYEDFYGQNLLQQSVLSKIERVGQAYIDLFQQTMKPFNSGCVPLKIPYGVVAFFFLRRVIRESNLPLKERFQHVNWIASNVLREKIIRP
jgi:hypothetical protein